jgi:iron complex outermembrane receptor protein
MIDWVMDTRQGEQAQWQSVNHTKINSYGIEANATLDLRHLLKLETHQSTLDISYNYIEQDKDLERGIVSQYALEYLRHKLVARLQTDVWRQLSMGLSCRWQDRVGSYTNFSDEICDYRHYSLVDARVQWEAPRYTLYVEANNLLDNRSYVDFGNVQQPGLWLIGGVKIQLLQ